MKYLILALAFIVPAALAQEEKVPSVEEIVNKANQAAYYKGDDGRAKVKMTITDGQDRKRTREFTILRRDDPPPEEKKDKGNAWCGDQKMYVFFHRPADVNKMVFMVWKHVDERVDDRWLYLPSLDLVKRIAATEKRTSFVGSDFFYEDVSGRNIDEDTHELDSVSKTYYKLKSTPTKPDEVEFGHYIVWIHTKTFLSVKTEYYDKKGEKYREYQATEVKEVQGFPTVMKATMKDLRTGSTTVLEYSDVKYNLELPEDIFTERFLRRAPMKYLK